MTDITYYGQWLDVIGKVTTPDPQFKYYGQWVDVILIPTTDTETQIRYYGQWLDIIVKELNGQAFEFGTLTFNGITFTANETANMNTGSMLFTGLTFITNGVNFSTGTLALTGQLMFVIREFETKPLTLTGIGFTTLFADRLFKTGSLTLDDSGFESVTIEGAIRAFFFMEM